MSDLIIDTGSGLMKVGFGGEDAPRDVFSTTVGRPKPERVQECHGRAIWVGEPLCKNFLDFSWPVERGEITNWEDMELIWKDTLDQVEAGTTNVMIPTPPTGSEAQDEKVMELMFETFGVAAATMPLAPLLALFSSGRTTGVVLESGHGCTIATALHDTQPQAAVSTQLAGCDVTAVVRHLLPQECPHLSLEQLERAGVQEALAGNGVKGHACYVALEFDGHVAEEFSMDESFGLPDGTELKVAKLRALAPEVLFQPRLMEECGLPPTEAPALQGVVAGCLLECAEELRPEIAGNIVLSGGNTMFAGLDERLQLELDGVVGEWGPAVVPETNGERKYHCFTGGSIMSQMGAVNWTTKEEYQECGGRHQEEELT
eukprot:TRINITY_DN19476_c0_g1_i14.p1 TRINITY_DN19476_c0_g1~~TRINITY_DN19476_c0_g1_i14.p1  ORF type:complete len:373 (-),score=121.72 TRINITY_DN19476_c0_g1_i14:364-1482(-)